MTEIKEPTRQRNALGMSGQRVLLVNAVIVLLIVGPLLCIAFDSEYWPFSQYPMFSDVERKHSFVEEMHLYGVTREKPHHEFLLADEYIRPFSESHLSSLLKELESKRDPAIRSRLLNKALLVSLRRYEKSRLAGNHDGPPLQGIRLYFEEWEFDARAQTVDQPDHRKRIFEVGQRSDN